MVKTIKVDISRTIAAVVVIIFFSRIDLDLKMFLFFFKLLIYLNLISNFSQVYEKQTSQSTA